MIRQSKFKKTISLQIFILWIVIPLLTVSCASLGSKTLYIDKEVSITKPTKIVLPKPIFINCIGGLEENYSCVEKYINLELTPYNISVSKTDFEYKDFDKIGYDTTNTSYGPSDADFLMFAKVTRLTAMGQTRDYKVEYKFVSTKDNKLKFHSKYNTTVGATVVVLPGIKDFPNTDEMMAIAIRSGLYEFKKNVLKK